MKKTCIALLVAIFVVGFSLAVQPTGQAAPETSQEKAAPPVDKEKARTLLAGFQEKILPLADKLWGRMLELRSLDTVSNVTKEDLRNLVDEIVSLRSQIRMEHAAMVKAFEKEGLPLPKGCHGMNFGCPMGMMMGSGMGMGHGGMMGGDGPGFGPGMMGHGMPPTGMMRKGPGTGPDGRGGHPGMGRPGGPMQHDMNPGGAKPGPQQ